MMEAVKRRTPFLIVLALVVATTAVSDLEH
jgi:hypothetical protein